MATHPISRTLLSVLENQAQRIEAALEGLTEEVSMVEPGRDCHSIHEIGRHLLNLQRFQLTLLGSPLASRTADADAVTTLGDLQSALRQGLALVGQAIADHDPEDWFAVPEAPRHGPWGEEPTLARFVRPLNDLTNHLGGIRAIRRIHGCPVERTQ